MIILALMAVYLLIRTATINAATDKNHEPALLRILIDYFHFTLIIYSYDLNWPDSLESALNVLSIIGAANDRVLSFACFVQSCK